MEQRTYQLFHIYILSISFLAGNIANTRFPLYKEQVGIQTGRERLIATEPGARSPVDSDSSLPGLMSVNRGKKEAPAGPSSEIEANLKVDITKSFTKCDWQTF